MKRDILLIDDVLTTGTTASECARVLLRAGALRVWVATAARTLKIFNSASSPLNQPEEILENEPEDDLSHDRIDMAANG